MLQFVPKRSFRVPDIVPLASLDAIFLMTQINIYEVPLRNAGDVISRW